jgi:diguanylate cyclase (GGDEF)-like protein/PAS domain S-box-containing protein
MSSLRHRLIPKRLTPFGVALLYAAFAALWIIASGLLLTFSVADPLLQGRIELAKGLLFVTVTSGLLYLLLKGWREPVTAEQTPPPDAELPTAKKKWLPWLLLALALAVPLLGYSIIRLHTPLVEKDAYANLEAVARLKAEQIEHWLLEQQSVGTMLADHHDLADPINDLIHDPANAPLSDAIVDRLNLLQKAFRYDGIVLLDTRGMLVLGLGQHQDIPAGLPAMLEQIMANKTVLHSDLYRDDRGATHLDWLVPIIDPDRAQAEVIAILVLRTTAERFLYPLIKQWPTASDTAETLLVRREGESIRFLNELHHRQGTAMVMTRPLNSNGLPAAAAIEEMHPGTVQGSDYRGIPVLAAYRPVAGTDWHIITKIDREEVLAPLHQLVRWVSLVALVAIIALSAFALMLWRQHRRLHRLATQAQVSAVIRENEQRFRAITQSAHDAIVSSDENGSIVGWNPSAARMFGYSEQEILGQSLTVLMPERFLADHREGMARASAAEEDRLSRPAINMAGLRKDGSEFPLEMSLSQWTTTAGRFFTGILRDVTERQAADAKIRTLTHLYSALSQCNQAIVRCEDEEQMYDQVCRAAVQQGEMKMAWIGLIEPDGRTIRPVASFGDGSELLEHIPITTDADCPFGRVPTGTAIRENRPFWRQDLMHDPAAAAWHDQAGLHGWAAAATLPLRRNGSTVGAFTLYAGEVDAYTHEIRNLLSEMAEDIGFALSNFAREEVRRQAEAKLSLAARVFEQSSEGFVICDPHMNILSVNRAFSEITGYSETEALGQNPSLLKSGRQDADFYRDMWEHINETGSWQGEIWNRRKSGEIYPEWLSISAARGDHGELTHYIGIFSDITQHKKTEEHIRYLAHYDALTGLPNRSLLNDRIKIAIAQAQRRKQQLTLMFIDLDRFKNVNDSLGHLVGDRLLIEVAQRLKTVVRDEDTVSRLGGDEFILLLPATDADGAIRVAEKIIQALTEAFLTEGNELSVTPSIGIAMYPADGQQAERLLQCADSAMYRAKEAGRNTFRFFTAEMQVHAIRELQLENALRRALERNELSLNYQPQIDLASGRIIGSEALLRWNNMDFGTVSPAEFVPLAEDSGQILAIGEWVMRTAVAQIRAWQQAGLPLLPVAVNLSAVQFRQKNLPQLVHSILKQHDLEPKYLELELTERITMEDPAAAIAIMDELHAIGIQLSIDDFGTGYSSLAYLKRFRVQKLKIDRSFVRDITRDPEDEAIINAVISLARSLNLRTIAEGVETIEQLEFLRQHHCDEIQGYYFSRPLSTEAFALFLQHAQSLIENA